MTTTPLASLVEHQESVEADAGMDLVVRRFQEHGQHYMAVLEGDAYLGLLSDARVGTMLGSRYGFALHVRERARHHLLADALCAGPDWPLLRLLDAALNRRGASFHHDVPLVEPGGRFLGIIPVQRLVREQARIMAEQMELVERQRGELEASNQHLTWSLSELHQSEGRYVSLYHRSPLGVALLSQEGHVETCNPRLQGWMGRSGGTNGWDLSERMSPGEYGRFRALVMPLREETRPAVVEGEFTLRGPSGVSQQFRIHASWIDETEQICAVFEDVTRQRILERGMALQEKAALLERLAGGIAHELNNKLTPIVGFADLLSLRLASLPDAPKALGQCRLIRASAEEAVRMVRQLLNLGRPPQSEKAFCDLNQLVQEAWTMVSFRLKGLDQDASIRLASCVVPIHADGSQIKQVVVNLLLNAMDALESSPRKSLQLSVQVHEASAILRVMDTGQGISRENLQRIFDPFFSTKAPDRGTGLGLSVCLSILRQHDGDIQVESAPNEGTTFTVTLPLAENASVPALAQAHPAALPLREASQSLRILVVDDEPSVTCLVKATLETHCGWQVEEFHRVEPALEALDRRGFDLVITDLRMPGLDGFALLSWMRKHRPGLLSKSLVITADEGNVDLEADWGVRLLRKPFSSTSLVESCRSRLEAPEGAASAGTAQDAIWAGSVTKR
jgi:two-component system NtrC family sensor kinase